MSTVVAVAGGTRGMGLAIVKELKKFPDLYTVTVLSRNADANLAKELGVKIVTVNYESVDHIKQILEEENVHTLISNVFITNGVGQSQNNLIRGAEVSSVTKRFVPSTFDTPYDEE